MAASVIQAQAIEYTFPQPNQASINQLHPPWFYYQVSTPAFQTISANTESAGDISGFLFVPTFDANDPCSNLSAPYVPNNVTTISSLPPPSPQFTFAAIAPWLSSNATCMYEYLKQANNAQAHAFLTYIPGPSNSSFQSGSPPNASDPIWALDNGGAWMNMYGFPVYALNSHDGNYFMQELAVYSGNVSSLPDSASLVDSFGAGASARIYMQATIMPASPLPSLWVFLLIVVAILIGVLALASIIMRIIQRRRRTELRGLIISGQVDLESLGIARVKVTQDVLNTMPLYIYVTNGETPGAPHAPPAESDESEGAGASASGDANTATKRRYFPSVGIFERKAQPAPASASRARTGLPAILEEKSVSFPQETCVICLEDYENHVTAVRWLPCGHAFHPACIDPLLLEYSSLCPTCKGSVLPKDYVPEITNVMVRRERLMRRLRDLEAREQAQEQRFRNAPAHFRGISRFMPRNSATEAQAAAAGSAIEATSATRPVEMQNMSTDGSGNNAVNQSNGQNRNNRASGSGSGVMTRAAASNPRPARAGRHTSSTSVGVEGARRPENVSREEWARQRAEALLGTGETVEQAERREEARLPAWRRALGPLFPTLRS